MMLSPCVFWVVKIVLLDNRTILVPIIQPLSLDTWLYDLGQLPAVVPLGSSLPFVTWLFFKRHRQVEGFALSVFLTSSFFLIGQDPKCG